MSIFTAADVEKTLLQGIGPLTCFINGVIKFRSLRIIMTSSTLKCCGFERAYFNNQAILIQAQSKKIHDTGVIRRYKS